ncbi:MAG: DUF2480 family protein [Sphingobacteriales bacterium]|uniref:DUF2480 family protein n=1 Tax=Hydrotalea flava TaxID=714549 RepID=UPI0008356322|nr:DUF2480 family protein [Hydrotalea flava]RTL47980.1 MAG: DUF2480 family protein [Sphingobacteriales bacterium]
METPIVNKVAESGLITLDLAGFSPSEPLRSFDLKEYLFMELILKEKDFRAALQAVNWEQYTGAIVAIHCTADAIIPMWAYMLVSAYLTPVAKTIFCGTPEKALEFVWIQNIKALEAPTYTNKRVVIKGCGDTPVPESVFVAITQQLQPYVKSIMYGEPCSTVPVFKKK